MGEIKLQSFTIIFNKPVAVYTLGEYVNGFCCISLKGEMNLNQLEIRLFGSAETEWTESYTTGTGDDEKTETVTYRGSHPYFSQNYYPFQYQTNDKILNGEHRIPFNFVIPESGIPNSYESQNWSIKYFVEGIIHKNHSLNHYAKALIDISFPVFINEQILKAPIAFSNDQTSIDCFCSTSLFSLSASIAHIGQRVGSFTSVNCIAFNGSKSTINLRATLKLITHLKAENRSTVEKMNISRVFGSRVDPGMTNTETLSLLIPDNLPILYDCPIIDLEYKIVVTLDIPYSRDLHVELPVLLTNQILNFENLRY